MSTRVILTTLLLLTASLAFVPQATAIADMCEQPLPAGDAVRDAACVIVDAVAAPVMCFYNNPPRDWLSVCIN